MLGTSCPKDVLEPHKHISNIKAKAKIRENLGNIQYVTNLDISHSTRVEDISASKILCTWIINELPWSPRGLTSHAY